MPKLRKVYLPQWMTWFAVALLVPMWMWLTYEAFFTPEGAEELGVVGWAVVSLVLLGSLVVLVLMGQRRLPAYLIEEEEDERPSG